MNTRTRTTTLLVACLLGPTLTADAQVVRQLTHVRSQVFEITPTSLDDTGTLLYFSSSSESFGITTDGRFRIVQLATATDEAVHLFPFVPSLPPSVSDDGDWVAFASEEDLTGGNPDKSPEVFLASVDGKTLIQLTDFADASAVDLRDVVVAGSGNRVAFVNQDQQDQQDQLFVVEADGTNLRQIAATLDGVIDSLSISDNGVRLVFVHRGDPFGTNPDLRNEVFAILEDGTELRQVTSTEDGVSTAVLSGDGSRVACEISFSVFVVDWAGTNFSEIGRGRQPTLTDDGRYVVYTGSESGTKQVQRKDLSSADPPVPLTFDPTIHHSNAVVSGDGSRVAYKTSDSSDTLQLNLMNGNGTDERRLGAHTPYQHVWEPDIAAAGGRITFTTNADLVGTNSGYNDQVYKIESDGSELTQVTSLTASSELAWHPRITGDGADIIFMSYSDLTGVDQDGLQKTFGIDADGNALRQLSGVANLGEHADVADDGSMAVLQDLAGLTHAALDGSTLTPFLPTFWGGQRVHPRVDATGTWVVFHDFDQAYRVSTDGAVFEQISTDGGVFPAISGDGARIAFSSSGDPLETNPDGNGEVFVFEPATATLRQLTEAAQGSSESVAISADGVWVYFKSDVGWTEPGSIDEGQVDLFRVPAMGGAIERVGGLGGGGFSSAGGRRTVGLEVDGTGKRAVIAITADWTGENADASQELFVVDFTVAPKIVVGKDAPTVVSWDVEAGPLTYDVIRGDVADVANLGGSVALGPVACIESDSTDNTTIGFEDTVQPNRGQVLFYLYRGSQGSSKGPGSWGAGTMGERTTGNGACD